MCACKYGKCRILRWDWADCDCDSAPLTTLNNGHHSTTVVATFSRCRYLTNDSVSSNLCHVDCVSHPRKVSGGYKQAIYTMPFVRNVRRSPNWNAGLLENFIAHCRTPTQWPKAKEKRNKNKLAYLIGVTFAMLINTWSGPSFMMTFYPGSSHSHWHTCTTTTANNVNLFLTIRTQNYQTATLAIGFGGCLHMMPVTTKLRRQCKCKSIGRALPC